MQELQHCALALIHFFIALCHQHSIPHSIIFPWVGCLRYPHSGFSKRRTYRVILKIVGVVRYCACLETRFFLAPIRRKNSRVASPRAAEQLRMQRVQFGGHISADLVCTNERRGC